MSDTTEHLRAWGCPSAYADEYPNQRLYGPLGEAVRRVASAANWYPEQTAAVVAMALAGDADALRAWDRDALIAVGRETAMTDEDDAEGYADAVIAALRDLANTVEAVES